MFSTLYGTHFSLQMHFKLSSAICFDLDQSKILSSVNELTFYRTILWFWDPEKKSFENIVEKEENAAKPAFSPFPSMFSILLLTENITSATFYLSSAYAINLVLSITILFGLE